MTAGVGTGTEARASENRRLKLRSGKVADVRHAFAPAGSALTSRANRLIASPCAMPLYQGARSAKPVPLWRAKSP